MQLLFTMDEIRICQRFAERVVKRAELDMLSGHPITGAHHRALVAELNFMANALALERVAADPVHRRD